MEQYTIVFSSATSRQLLCQLSSNEILVRVTCLGTHRDPSHPKL